MKNIEHGMKFYGVATVGERGQVVIPSKARKEMKIGMGDKMLVVKGVGHGPLVFIKVNEMKDFLGGMSKMIGKIKDKIGG